MKLQNSKILIKSLFAISVLTYSNIGQSMIKALNTAATGMAAQEANVNTISNNIANANTIGFKRSRTEFEDLGYETIRSAGARSSANTFYSVGVQIGSGAKISGIKKEFSTGQAKLTNNPFDLMVSGGEGFFGIMMPNGSVQYSRDGAFSVDASGNLVNSIGYKIFPGIQFPPNTKSVHISNDGTTDVYLSGQLEPIKSGQIVLFTFINPVGLNSAGRNLYAETKSSGVPIQNIAGTSNAGVIQQGALETSNVSIMTEMTDLIKAQRAYEMNSKVMGVADQMLQTVNNIR